MSCRHNFIAISWLLFMGAVLSFSPVAAQLPEREYVVGVGDQLNIQVFNQVQPLPNFSAQVSVRSDRMITMPWLGDVKAAGLKKSTLTTLLESDEYLGKYLTDPHVTITPANMSANILVVFSGVINVEQELPRDARLGQVLRELAPNIQQFDPNFDAITITSTEGEVFAADQNLRLQWGDTILIPANEPEPTPLPQPTPLPVGAVQPLAQFTDEEYQSFQTFMQTYPEALEVLLPLVRNEEDAVFMDLVHLSDEQRAQLPQAVLDELKKYPPKAAPSLQLDFALVGIRVNLKVEGFQEVFLAMSNPEGGTVIRRFREGDVIRPGKDGEKDLVLVGVDEQAQQILVQQGDVQQVVAMAPPLSTTSLVGILTNSLGHPEAILQGPAVAVTAAVPLQRKRYTEGEEVEPNVKLVKIVQDQQLAILQNKEAVQILFLRDSRKRAASQPQPESSSPIAGPDPFADSPTAPSPEENLRSMLKQQMPQELQALDTLSELFFASPLF